MIVGGAPQESTGNSYRRLAAAQDRIRPMTNSRSGSGPDADKDANWTNETLPLGLRRELLDRDLQSLIARKRSRPSSSSAAAPSEQAATGHPVGDAPAPDGHAS